MTIYQLDGERMTDKEATHVYLAESFGFPEHYGKNLDALADCLWQLKRDAVVVMVNDRAARKNLGRYADSLFATFEELSVKAGFQWIICED